MRISQAWICIWCNYGPRKILSNTGVNTLLHCFPILNTGYWPTPQGSFLTEHLWKSDWKYWSKQCDKSSLFSLHTHIHIHTHKYRYISYHRKWKSPNNGRVLLLLGIYYSTYWLIDFLQNRDMFVHFTYGESESQAYKVIFQRPQHVGKWNQDMNSRALLL